METLEALSTQDKYIELFRQNRGLIGGDEPDLQGRDRREGARRIPRSPHPVLGVAGESIRTERKAGVIHSFEPNAAHAIAVNRAALHTTTAG